MIRTLAVSTVAAATLMPGAAGAFEFDYIGGRAGTLGVGGEVGVSIIPGVTLRGAFNTFEYSFEEELDGVNYDGDLNLGSFGAQVDLAPFPFVPVYVTGGVYVNDNEISAAGRPTGDVQIGNDTFTADEVGTLNTSFAFDDIAPYAGLGFKFTLIKVQFALEGGAFFQGAPQASLTATGTLASDPTFQAELEQERQNIQNDLDNFEIYPVVNGSVRWKF